MAAVEAILISGLFLVVDVPEMAWTLHVENGSAKVVTDVVGSPSTSQYTGSSTAETTTTESMPGSGSTAGSSTPPTATPSTSPAA